MRAAMLLGVGSVLVAWAVISLQTHALQPLPNSVLALLGILVGGKFGQKFIEPDGKPISTANPQNENASAQTTGAAATALAAAPELFSAVEACDFQCVFGPLVNSVAWRQLKALLSPTVDGAQGDPATGRLNSPHETKPGEEAK
jgi:hypothetical protein